MDTDVFTKVRAKQRLEQARRNRVERINSFINGDGRKIMRLIIDGAKESNTTNSWSYSPGKVFYKGGLIFSRSLLLRRWSVHKDTQLEQLEELGKLLSELA